MPSTTDRPFSPEPFERWREACVDHTAIHQHATELAEQLAHEYADELSYNHIKELYGDDNDSQEADRAHMMSYARIYAREYPRIYLDAVERLLSAQTLRERGPEDEDE